LFKVSIHEAISHSVSILRNRGPLKQYNSQITTDVPGRILDGSTCIYPFVITECIYLTIGRANSCEIHRT